MNFAETVKINDVLSGRGNGPNLHSGNIVFRRIVASKSEAYNSSSCKIEKRKIVDEVIGQVTSMEGRFLGKRDKNGFRRILDEKQIKKKTSQALRDLNPNDKISPSQNDTGLAPGFNREEPRDNDTTVDPILNPQSEILMKSTNIIHDGKSFNCETLKNCKDNSLALDPGLHDSTVDSLLGSYDIGMSVDRFNGLQSSNGVCCMVKDESDQSWSTSFPSNGNENEERDTCATNIEYPNERESETPKDPSYHLFPNSVTNLSLSPSPSIVSESEKEKDTYDKDCGNKDHFTNHFDFLEKNKLFNETSNEQYLPSKWRQLMRRSIVSLHSSPPQSQSNLVLDEDEDDESNDTQQTMNRNIKIYEVKSEGGLTTFVAPNYQIKSEAVDYCYAACSDTNEMSLSFSNIQKALQIEKEDDSSSFNGSISAFSFDYNEMFDISIDTCKFCSDMMD